jgi:hypothetical protein
MVPPVSDTVAGPHIAACGVPFALTVRVPMFRTRLSLERLENREAPSGIEPVDPNAPTPPPPAPVQAAPTDPAPTTNPIG